MNTNTNQFTAPQAKTIDLIGTTLILLVGITVIIMTIFLNAEPASAPTNAGIMGNLFSAAQAAPTPTPPAIDLYADGPLRVEAGADGNRWVLIEAGSLVRCDSLLAGRPIYNSIKGGEFITATIAAWPEAQHTAIVNACIG